MFTYWLANSAKETLRLGSAKITVCEKEYQKFLLNEIHKTLLYLSHC